MSRATSTGGPCYLCSHNIHTSTRRDVVALHNWTPAHGYPIITAVFLARQAKPPVIFSSENTVNPAISIMHPDYAPLVAVLTGFHCTDYKITQLKPECSLLHSLYVTFLMDRGNRKKTRLNDFQTRLNDFQTRLNAFESFPNSPYSSGRSHICLFVYRLE